MARRLNKNQQLVDTATGLLAPLKDPKTGKPIFIVDENNPLCGEGSFAKVFRVYDTRAYNRPTAAKICTKMTLGTLEVFEKEGMGLAHLQHPNIITLYSTAEPQGRPTFFMELADWSLADEIYGGGFTDQEILAAMVDICRGAEKIHTFEWPDEITPEDRINVHRDIKPSNILRVGPTYKLCDLGSAGKIGAKSTAASALAFRAPEFFPDGSGFKDGWKASADIYSLGCVIAVMYTGSALPFDETGKALIEQKKSGIDAMLKSIPNPGAKKVIKKCLGSPGRRYKTVDELINDLKKKIGVEVIELKEEPSDDERDFNTRYDALDGMVGSEYDKVHGTSGPAEVGTIVDQWFALTEEAQDIPNEYWSKLYTLEEKIEARAMIDIRKIQSFCEIISAVIKKKKENLPKGAEVKLTPAEVKAIESNLKRSDWEDPYNARDHYKAVLQAWDRFLRPRNTDIYIYSKK